MFDLFRYFYWWLVDVPYWLTAIFAHNFWELAPHEVK